MCTRSGGPVLVYLDLVQKDAIRVWMVLKDGMLTITNALSVTFLQWDVANLKIAVLPELPFSFFLSNQAEDSLCFCTLIDTVQCNKWLYHFTRFEVPVVGANGRPLIKKSRHQKSSVSDWCTQKS
tara:strand:+ start:9861 stop:10235 length:375 start_codon:yes stop_codon:yes gene_type:complete